MSLTCQPIVLFCLSPSILPSSMSSFWTLWWCPSSLSLWSLGRWFRLWSLGLRLHRRLRFVSVNVAFLVVVVVFGTKILFVGTKFLIVQPQVFRQLVCLIRCLHLVLCVEGLPRCLRCGLRGAVSDSYLSHYESSFVAIMIAEMTLFLVEPPHQKKRQNMFKLFLISI